MLPNYATAAAEEIQVLLRMLARQRQAYENELLEREAIAQKCRQENKSYEIIPSAFKGLATDAVITLLHRNIYYMLRLHKQLERLEKSTTEKEKPVISTAAPKTTPKTTADGKIMPDKKDWFNQRAWEKLNS